MVSSKGKERASSDSEDDEMNGTSSSVRPTNGGGGTQYNQSEEMTQEQHMQRTKDTRAGYRKLEADVAGESCALIELVRGGGATGGNTGAMCFGGACYLLGGGRLEGHLCGGSGLERPEKKRVLLDAMGENVGRTGVGAALVTEGCLWICDLVSLHEEQTTATVSQDDKCLTYLLTLILLRLRVSLTAARGNMTDYTVAQMANAVLSTDKLFAGGKSRVFSSPAYFGFLR